MASVENKEYYRGKIVKVNGPNKVLEMFNKLHPASIANFAHIHADGEEKNQFGSKIRSKIGLQIQEGSGNSLKVVQANITPEEVEYIYQGVCLRDRTRILDNLKIFGEPDKDGRCQANSLKVGFDSRLDKDGNARRSPWCIKISVGTGIKKMNQNGGSYCANGTFQVIEESYIYLSEYEMFRIFLRAKKFVDTWEFFTCQSLYYEGIKAQEEAWARWQENQKKMPVS